MQPAASTLEQDQCTRSRQLGPSLAAMPAQNAEAGGGSTPRRPSAQGTAARPAPRRPGRRARAQHR